MKTLWSQNWKELILSRHNINFYWALGPSKTRLGRLMVNLLDEYIPSFISGSGNQLTPLSPISRKFAIDIHKKEQGDLTSISWLPQK